MVLAKDETVVKEWEYASSKERGTETKYLLAVTNKRIISTSNNYKKNVREEIPVSAVKGIYASHERAFNLWAIFLMVLGVFIILMSIISLLGREASGSEAFAFILACLILCLGVFLVYLGWRFRLGGTTFTLTISTKEKEGMPMEIGAIKFFNFIKGKMKLKINYHVAEDIIETIGSLIII